MDFVADVALVLRRTCQNFCGACAFSNTSAAVVKLSNGNRHLFFQKHGGIITQAIYKSSIGQWDAATGEIVASDARKHTPLAMVNVLENHGAPSDVVTLCLHFRVTEEAK